MTNIFPTDFVEKVTPADNDKILLADSTDSDKIKYGKFSTFKWPKWDTGDTWPQGIQGIQGIQWATGATGATWPQWPAGADWYDWADGISFVPKGEYSAGTAYVANDVVSYLWSSFIALQSTTGNTPVEWVYWTLNASKGADGLGSGDMLKATYDPTNKQADAFSMDNMVETATKKIMTSAERTKLGNQSWTNTWDETTSTIKTKLGITTLSGSNTGDQDLSGLLPKSWGTMTGKVVSAGSSEVAKTYTPWSGAQTVTIDCAVNNIHEVQWNSSGTAITFAVSNVTNSQVFMVAITQGASTLSTITSWFSTIRWVGGTIPTLTATANKRDVFGFRRTGANTYDGFVIGQNI